MGRVILHIDLNSFFASAEVLKNPSLRGKPLAVAGSTRRSVVSTCSYEARKFGVHSAMPVSEAIRLCKDLIIVPSDFEFYEDLSYKFMNILKSYSSIYEQTSIDECYLDVSDEIKKYDRPLDITLKIQNEVYSKLGLNCSIGVAPNKFLAKMASDIKKPRGITVIRLNEVQSKLWPLEIEKMQGIGKKTQVLLKQIGINTIKDLATYKDTNKLKLIFKNNLNNVIKRANGIDDSLLVTHSESKSISVSTTLLEDISDYDEIKGVIISLSRKLSYRLKEENKLSYIISVTIRQPDFKQVVRSKKLDTPIYKVEDIIENTLNVFDDNWNEEPIRLIGIGLNRLIDPADYMPQMTLFDENDRVDNIIDELNSQLNSRLLFKASDLKKR